MKKEILLRLNQQNSKLLDDIVATSDLKRSDFIRELINQSIVKHLLYSKENTKEVKLELLTNDLKELDRWAKTEGLKDYEEKIYSILKKYIADRLFEEVKEEIIIEFREEDNNYDFEEFNSSEEEYIDLGTDFG